MHVSVFPILTFLAIQDSRGGEAEKTSGVIDEQSTAFQFVDGNGATLAEANWTVAHDSPLVESLVFLPWTVHAAPNRAVVGRSAVVAAILMATRPPPEDQRDALRAMPFLTHEILRWAWLQDEVCGSGRAVRFVRIWLGQKAT